jgi:hypothetical protein
MGIGRRPAATLLEIVTAFLQPDGANRGVCRCACAGRSVGLRDGHEEVEEYPHLRRQVSVGGIKH